MEQHGKPTNWKSKNQRDQSKVAYVIESVLAKEKLVNTPPFTVEQMEILKNLLSQSKVSKEPKHTIPSTAVAQRGNFHFLLFHRNSENMQIIDSRASNHMTSCSSL